MTGIFFSIVFLLPQISYAATLFLSPSSGNYSSGGQVSVSVGVNTEGESINAVDGTIGFNPSNLEVVSVSKSSSILNLWVQGPSYSNSAGDINFGGVVLNPGYSGSNGNIITIVFKAKGDGRADVNFKAGSVLANDGYGTNVLRAMNGASFNIGAGGIQQSPPASPKAETPTIVSDFEISSLTHPDQDKWYSNNDPVFQIKFPPDAKELKLVLSRRTTSTPNVSYIPPISEKKLENLDDGVWYLHSQFCGSSDCGRVSTYKFLIDTESPKDFEIIRAEDNDKTNPQPELIFETEDGMSGVNRYEIKIGKGEWFKISPEVAGSPYKLSLQAPAVHPVKIRAFDKAGNFSEAEYFLEVESIEPPAVNEFAKPIKSGERINISGTAEAAIKVISFLVKNPVINLETFSDEERKWSISYEQKIQEGNWEVYAYAVDQRGAVSVKSNSVILKVESASIFESAFNWLMKGFDALVNFIINGWLLIIFAILTVGFIYLIIKEFIPFIVKEFWMFVHIIREYRLSKHLKKRSKKMKFEFKSLYDDIKSELNLLEKIEKHRGLHPDEKYLKVKLEKYLRLLKSFK